MDSFHSIRFAVHPEDCLKYPTAELRKHFLVEDIFIKNTVQLTYTHYDRLVVGGAAPLSKDLKLETFEELKADYFLERRELGILNAGADGAVTVDGKEYPLKTKEALYVGRGAREVFFKASKNGEALYYFNSAPAHVSHATRKVSWDQAETAELGSLETANSRVIRKLLVNSVLPTCQLQMGLTEMKAGSVWNTMPPHTHTRRMEAYFYFGMPEGQVVCHFMGEPQETRHIWVKNNQAVISPPWSIHCGAGTSAYSFVWGMAGENLNYADMDAVKPAELK